MNFLDVWEFLGIIGIDFVTFVMFVYLLTKLLVFCEVVEFM